MKQFRFLVLAFFVATAPSAIAEEAKVPCTPQPACEFDDLIIKPAAPTPGLKPQDNVPRGINIQGLEPSDRSSFRMPGNSMKSLESIK